MERIDIHSKLYDYSVEFVSDFSKELSGFGTHTAYVIDKNVYSLYEQKFSDIDKNNIFFMDAVEHKKNMDTVLEIISFLQNLGVRKDWTVVCFGGGITQDVTTVASELFLRNLDWYFFPTTLLSMCDSCIGGKCGINYKNIKNQIGVFYPPKKIVIDTCFIDTLTDGDYLNGWGEIFKFSLTRDPDFYNSVKNESSYIPCDNIKEYIYRGLKTKQEIIEEDEFESDLRRILNYGHTFGHALEAFTDNTIPHGKGVIWGIDVVNFIAFKEKLISRSYYDEIKALIKKAFLKKEIEISDPAALFEIIKTDKKVKNGVISLAVLDGESHLIVYPMNIDTKLKEYFMEYIKETHEYYCN